MAFTTQLNVTRECSAERLRSLVRALQRLDCVVRIEPASADLQSGRVRLEVRVPSDGYTWIVTGGFGALVDAYSDAVLWRAPFAEFPNHGGQSDPLPDEPPRT